MVRDGQRDDEHRRHPGRMLTGAAFAIS